MKVHKIDHAKRFLYHRQVYCRDWKANEYANVERWRGVNCLRCLAKKPSKPRRKGGV